MEITSPLPKRSPSSKDMPYSNSRVDHLVRQHLGKREGAMPAPPPTSLGQSGPVPNKIMRMENPFITAATGNSDVSDQSQHSQVDRHRIIDYDRYVHPLHIPHCLLISRDGLTP